MSETKRNTTAENLNAKADMVEGWVKDDETIPEAVVCFSLGIAAAFREVAGMLREESDEGTT